MTESPDKVMEAIQERFAKVALAPHQEQKFPVGPASAKRLGYAAAEIDALPASVTESFAGVGNPFSIGDLQPGQTVVDIGSGAGMDSILAARRVGRNGKVIGVDMTPEMLAKADRNATAAGLSKTDFRLGSADALPVPGESVDVVISNGVFNLCLNKPGVVAEIFRVLRPGGRLQMADIL